MATTYPNLGASKAEIQHHYDENPVLYEHFLGPTLAYSSGFWQEPAYKDTLDAAQIRKLDWHIDRSGADSGRRVLDVGAGWGSLIKRLMVRRPDIDYVGLTMADGQAAYMRAYAPENFRIAVSTWQAFEDNRGFDSIISLEALEHFAHQTSDRAERIRAYSDFFDFCARALRPHGRVSLQVNGWLNIKPGSERKVLDETGISQFWRGGALPYGGELIAASERHFNVLLLDTCPRDYIYTLREWVRNLRRHADALTDKVGAETVQHYEKNLSTCLAAYVAGVVTCYRLVLERRPDVLAG